MNGQFCQAGHIVSFFFSFEQSRIVSLLLELEKMTKNWVHPLLSFCFGLARQGNGLHELAGVGQSKRGEIKAR